MKTEQEEHRSKTSKDSANIVDDLAFKDFKGAVTNDEFQAVLSLAKEEYLRCKRVLDARERFIKKTQDGMDAINAQAQGMPPGLAKKLIEGLARRADKETISGLGDEIKRVKHVVDFLNRFQDSSELIQYLDFNFKTEK